MIQHYGYGHIEDGSNRLLFKKGKYIMRYYIIAGEKSGDLHGGDLITALPEKDPKAEFRYWGGGCMEQASGYPAVVHYEKLAVMGLDFLGKILHLFQYLKYCKKDLLVYQPDALILIDYSGFNLHIAKYAKQNNIRTYYYIAPKVWAWRPQRIKTIKRYVDRMFTIFPFEKSFFSKYNYNVDFVGNPTVQQVRAYATNSHFLIQKKLDSRPIIALLPGSRMDEVKRILPILYEVTTLFPNYQFVVAATKDLPTTLYGKTQKYSNTKLVYEATYDLLAHAYAAIITSGTATLEAALYNVPQIVVYRTNGIAYWLYKKLVHIPYVSLVNILIEAPIVTELIQGQCTKEEIKKELNKLLADKEWRQKQQQGYLKIKNLLGNDDPAQTVANHVVNDICRNRTIDLAPVIRTVRKAT